MAHLQEQPMTILSPSQDRFSKESKSDLQGGRWLKNAKSVAAGLFNNMSSSTSAGSNHLDEELLRPGDAV